MNRNRMLFSCPCLLSFVSLVLGAVMAQAAGPASLSMENYPAFPEEGELRRLSGLYHQAQELQREHDYEAAAYALELLVDASWPFNLDVVSFKLSLARVYGRAQMGEKAAELLVQLENSTTTRSPLYPEIYYQLSTAILESGDVEEGIFRFRYLAENFASSRAGQQALRALARAYRDQSDLEQAWMYYDRYLVTYQGRRVRHVILLEVADMYFDAENPQRAEELTMRVWREIHRYPDSGSNGLRMLMTLRRHERFDAALVIASDLCAGEWSQAQEGCFRLGELLDTVGNAEDAVEAFRKVLHDFPLTRLSVRAYRAKGAVTGEHDPLPSLPHFIESDRENEHWESMMTEVARLAAARGYHRQVLAALKDIPRSDDRLSQQRARLILHAKLGLADDHPDEACHWLSRAIAVRPELNDHARAVRAWLPECHPEVSEAAIVMFHDIDQGEGRHAAAIMTELLRVWDPHHVLVRSLFVRIWNMPLEARHRLDLAPSFLEVALRDRRLDWSDVMVRTDFAMWETLNERAFDQRAYTGVFDALIATEKRHAALDWLLNFSEHARPLTMGRIRDMLDWLYREQDVTRFDLLLSWYLQWYPDALDKVDYAVKQVELRITGPDLSAAWAVVETWLQRMSREDGLELVSRVRNRFMIRGSSYVEPLNAYLLHHAQSDVESVAAHRQLGEYYLKMMDFDRAALHLERAFEKSGALPDRDKVRLGVGLLRAAMEAGYDEGYVNYLINGLDRVLASISDPAIRAQGGNQIGKLLHDFGLADEAYRILRMAANTPTDAASAQAALYNLAKSYAENGMRDEAMTTYREYLEQYSDQADQRWYNIALANALSLAMEGEDMDLVGELRMKTEALINGVHDPYVLLDLAQYFGRQGHESIEVVLKEKGLQVAEQWMRETDDLDEKYNLLNHTIKRLTKMGMPDVAEALGREYEVIALGDNKELQTEALYRAQYERFRAMLDVRPRNNVELTQLGLQVVEKAKEHGYADVEANMLYYLTKTAKIPVRWAIREDLAVRHSQNSHALESKIMVAGKAYYENDSAKAINLAFDALNQAANPFMATYADKHRYNAIYLAATLLKEQGRNREAETLFRELDNYADKDQGLYVKGIMDGSELYQ